MGIGTTTVIRQAFKQLEPDTLKTLRLVAQRRQYPARTVLCHQGEIEHTFYVVVEGQVAVTKQLESGEERILNVVGPNGYFGEMGLIDDSPRVADCTTMTPTTVLEVTEEEFDRFVETSPALAQAMMKKILAATRRIDRLYIEDLQQKNESLAKAYADLKAAQDELVEKERLEHEIALASEVQRNLVRAALPQYSDYGFAAHLRPAREVGGDFYHVMELDESHVSFLIADVADKGFHAALFMAVTRALFQQEAKHDASPAAVAQAVHQGMMEISNINDVFLTAFYAVLHRPSGRLRYVRAAQDRPLLYRPGVGVQPLAGDGRFLGMIDPLQLEEHTLQLQPGDRLVMFSDGVPDATDAEGEQYGNGRLQAAIADGGALPAAQLVKHLAQDVAAFCGAAAAFDDLTLLVLEAKGTT